MIFVRKQALGCLWSHLQAIVIPPTCVVLFLRKQDRLGKALLGWGMVGDGNREPGSGWWCVWCSCCVWAAVMVEV